MADNGPTSSSADSSDKEGVSNTLLAPPLAVKHP